MKLVQALGAKTEDEAIKVVAAFNEFSASLKELTGQESSGGIIGVVTAWKQTATTDAERKKNEGETVSATIDAMKASGVRGADGLQAVYEASGFAAFRDAADKAKADTEEAGALIKNLVETEKRLAPAAKSAFEKLFASHGLDALKAAAEALPPKGLVSVQDAPISASGDGGLTESEQKAHDKLKTPEAKAKFLELRASRRSAKES